MRISSITGHQLDTVASIMKHYLVMQPEMADEAIGRLNRWMAEQGIAV